MPLAYFSFFYQKQVPTSLVWISIGSFLIATFLLSPDLDLSHSTPTKNWGLFRFIWKGYSKMFRHRGKSHSFMFSSISKCFYLIGISLFSFTFILFIYFLYNGETFPHIFEVYLEQLTVVAVTAKTWGNAHKGAVFAGFCGLLISDWMHILSDRIISVFKKVSKL